MSTFAYNGVALDYVHTHKSEQIAEWSEDGTEYLRTKITLSIQAVMSPPLLPSQSTQRPAVTMNQVRQQLLLPRQALLFQTSAADTLYNVYGSAVAVPPTGGQLDVNNGPHPEHVSIVAIQGTESYLLDGTWTFYLIDCEGPALVSHRWNESVSIDEHGMSTITRMGKMVIRSDVATNADTVRNLAVPPMRPGFRRTGMEFQLQQDGLALMYRITDTEEYIQPPPYATKAQGEFVIHSPTAGMQKGEVHVALHASKNYKQSDILGKAVTIAIRKVAGPQGRFFDPTNKTATKGLPILWNRVLRAWMFENKVEVQFQVLYDVTTFVGVSGSALSPSYAEFDIHPQYAVSPDTFCGSTDTLPDLGPGASAGLNLLVKALRNTPCSNPDSTYDLRTIGSSAGVSGLQETPHEPVTPPVVYVVKELPELDSVLYGHPDPADLGGGVYTVYRVQSKYKTDGGVRELPTSGGPVYVSFSGPATRLVVKWTAERVGSKPRIPSLSIDPNTVPLKQVIKPVEVNTEEGTMPIYRISGKFTYGFKDPSQVIYQYPVPPYLDPSQIDDPYITEDDLNQRIADPAFFGLTPLPGLSITIPPPDFLGRVPD